MISKRDSSRQVRHNTLSSSNGTFNSNNAKSNFSFDVEAYVKDTRLKGTRFQPHRLCIRVADPRPKCN